jgi:hypothetical protein
MKTTRYDIQAGRNVLRMLERASPNDYAILLTKLKTNAGMAGLGQNGTEEQTTGFWGRIFEAGTNALTTIVDYKLQERLSKEQQDQYEAAAAAEMERQAYLASQARTQAMEYSNQMELVRQQSELERASQRAKSKFNWALIAAGGLGLLLVYRLAFT